MMLFNTPVDDLPALMTDKDLAKVTPWARHTFQNKRAAKEGPEYIKIEGRIFYTKEAVVNFFANALTQPL